MKMCINIYNEIEIIKSYDECYKYIFIVQRTGGISYPAMVELPSKRLKECQLYVVNSYTELSSILNLM